MADKYQTQCPHCGIKFQISDQQLALAGGKVRCGSCLQVFQASQHLVPLAGQPAGTASARSTAAPSARPSVQKPGAAPMPKAAPAQPAAPAPKAAPTAAKPVAKPAAPIPPPVEDDIAADGYATDDDLADMILRELEAPPPPPPPVVKRPPPPPASAADDDDLADMILRELDESPAIPPAHAVASTTPPPPAPNASAAGARDNLQWSLPRAAAPVAPPAAAAGNKFGIEDNKTRIPLKTGGDDVINEDLIDDGPEDLFADSRVDNRVLESEDDIFGGGASTLLETIEEPVDESWAKELIGEKVEDDRDARVRKFTEFTADNMSLSTTGVQPRARLESRDNRSAGSDGLDVDDLDFLNDGNMTMQDVELPGLSPGADFDTVGMAHEVVWSRDIFWGALCALFALLLLAQYLTFNFDTLSRDEDWRGVYEVACGALGCELPGESDVSRIQGANLVVRSHPHISGALMVDAIVYNRAPFAQPFPDLELAFSDRQGNLLAGRVFTPAEYLKGELAGSESMAPDTPIHLSLELLDPGAGAVNYELRFLPAATSS